MANEIIVDRNLGAGVVNYSDLDTNEVMSAAAQQVPEIAELVSWTRDTRGSTGRSRAGGLFDRDRFVCPENPMDQMRVASDASNDDVVSSFLDASEAMAIRNLHCTVADDDEDDIWKQILDGSGLEERMREIWREVAIYSQAYVAAWYETKDFTVRGKSTQGVKRKKTYKNLVVPSGLTVLDPFKVIPVGMFLFGHETLCLPANSQVYTPTGPKAIVDILPGDSVWSVENNCLVSRQVKHTWSSGERELWSIKTQRGTLRCTPNHPVKIMDRGGTPHTRDTLLTHWVRADEVQRGDFVVGLASVPDNGSSAPEPSVGIAKLIGINVGDGTVNRRMNKGKTAGQFFWSHVDTSSDCWIWTGQSSEGGYPLWEWAGSTFSATRIAWQFVNGTVPKSARLLRDKGCPPNCVNPSHRRLNQDGDGVVLVDPQAMTTSRRSAFSVAAHVKEVDSWQSLIEGELGVSVQRYHHHSSPHAFQLNFTSRELATWADEVMVYKSPERFVPSWVWTSSRKVQEAFLEGYLEADGHEPEHRPNYAQVGTTSERLARELRVLCEYLGHGVSNLRETKPSRSSSGVIQRRHSCWSFHMTRVPRSSVPHTYSHRQNNPQPISWPNDDLRASFVQSSCSTGQTETVYDIEVEGSHNFIADGFLVHNCYYADPTERDVIDSWLLGDDDSEADEIIKRLIVGKYEPDFRDRKEIGNMGVDPNRLYVLNPQYVWRVTATRPGYQRFSPIRLASVFELLDLKHQLRQSDRATLIGASNFILLVKKGSDKEPAKQFEIQSLQQNMRTVSKVPVIVGDHRLNIEIITPKTDNTLDPDRYTIIDMRIMDRLYGMFITAAAGRDDSLKLARVVARGLEARREAIVKSCMDHLIMPTFRLNDQLVNDPDLVVYPKRIALDFDPSLATYLLDLRDRGDLSRDSILSEIDYDEESESEKRKIEKEKYDDVFQPPTILPGMGGAPGMTAPNPAPKMAPPGSPNDPKRAGRAQGGNHGQGGNGNVGRGAGQAPRRGTPKDPTPPDDGSD